MKILQLMAAAVMATLTIAAPASAQNLAINGDFETGDFTGWTQFPTPGSYSITGPGGPDVFAGDFSGLLDTGVIPQGGGAVDVVLKQANVGIGVVQPNELIDISFWAKGDRGVGGVQFVEFFSELSGGGTSSTAILAGPETITSDWAFYSFQTPTGPDVSGGVTLQLKAGVGPIEGSSATLFVDDVSISRAIPEPSCFAMLGIGAFGLVARRRRR